MNSIHSPQPYFIPFSRRRLLQSLALATAGFWARGAFAEALTLTPRQTEGPYFPDHLPLDQDNDLIHVTDHLTPAVGTITNLGGRLLDRSGKPIKGALIELWQADDHGTYIHSRGAQKAERDPNFQGYGKFESVSDGGYRFRTIKPGLYSGRTRHYHFGITLPGRRRFTTQLYLAGEPQNARDMVLSGIRDEAQKASVIREFKPIAGSPELTTTWDIVMGLTPSDSAEEERGPRSGFGDRPPRPRDGQRPPPPQ